MPFSLAVSPLQEFQDFRAFRDAQRPQRAGDALWLGQKAPRYTSYPPATTFFDSLTHEDYKNALSCLPEETPVSLYLHVPFCRSLCLYCGCHTMPTSTHERVNAYLFSMQREIEALGATFTRPRRVARIHFGGGSPNILSEKELGLAFGALARCFDLNAIEESAMELDPRLVTKAQARTMRLLGVTRASLGVQDFNPAVQKAIGRVHSYAKIAHACFVLRDAGIPSVSIDLMYGLPLQTPSSMADSARLAATLRPDRIALFSYAHMPSVKKHQAALDAFRLPSPRAALALEASARAVLVDEGYEAIGMDHFARPEDSLTRARNEGRLRRSFQGYTDDVAPLLGLGASAIGRLRNVYFQNTRDVDDYRNRIAQKGLATVKGKRLTREDLFRASIINDLMTTFRVDLGARAKLENFDVSVLAPALEALKPFEDAGLVRREGAKILVTTPNRMAVRAIAALFDAYPRTEETPASKII